MLGQVNLCRRANRRAHAAVVLALVLLALAAVASSAQAGFGVEPGSFTVTAVNRDGSTDTQAGSHPYAYTVAFAFNHGAGGALEGHVRDVVVDLPPGLVGDPLALPRCPRQDFEGIVPRCLGDTQAGVLAANIGGIVGTGPVSDMLAPPDSLARLGFALNGLNAFQDVSLRSAGGYDVAVAADNVPSESLYSLSQTVWGVPADAGHDAERQCVGAGGGLIEGCAFSAEPKPFLSLPTSCAGPLETTLRVDSKDEPGVYREQTVLSRDAGGNPVGLSGCDKLPFAPSISAQPETTVADSPTGLDVDLHIPQNEEPEGLATADLKDAVVTLPPGLVVNPSSADGLQGCSSAQIGFEGVREGMDAFSPEPANCPEASKIGTVEVDTPVIGHPLPGAVYIAAQSDNPFHSLLAIYIVVEDPATGVVVKLAGHVEPNPETGQLTTVFADNPQLPFEDFKLDFFGGPRAALTTPPTCGKYTTTTDLTPWTTPEGRDATPSGSFQVGSGPGGSTCAGTPAQEPVQAGFEAGTTTPLAGAYSPFVLTLKREDGSQPIRALNLTLPPGLSGRLAGVEECPQSGIEQAERRSGEGEGAIEQASPSCPSSSEVGTITVGAGSGAPFHVQGHAYLAGPYEGAPFSLAIVVPAVAGPFDLGVVVVRSALYINPETAQVTVKSDPIPQMLDGIPLDVRSIAVDVSRPEFTLNPTSCAPLSIGGEVFAVSATAALSSPFQVGACNALGFAPTLTASTAAKTSKTGGASLVVKVTQKPGEADIHQVDLQLPLALPARLTTLQQACTAAQFAANPAGCPAASAIGTATARSPLLQVPLTGPAYLVSHGGAAFPDVEFVLQGDERGGDIEVVLDGGTDIKKGITYSKFETVPDEPISSFETVLPEGPHSVLAADGSLCAHTKTVSVRKRVTERVHGRVKHVTRTVSQTVAEALTMPTAIVAQNGAVVTQNTKIDVTGCPKAKKAAKKQSNGNKKKDKHRKR